MAHFTSQGMYPRIGYIINSDLPNIINDHLKFKVFKQFGGFSDNEARQALKANSPLPQISIRNYGPNIWGHYPGSGNEIYISKTITEQYETLHRQWSNSPEFSAASPFSYPGTDIKLENDKWKYTISIARLHIEATILHEIVHWGDKNAQGDDGKGADGRTRDQLAHKKRWSDWGHLFVKRAYGNQIDVDVFQPKQGLFIKQNDVGIKGWLGWDKNNRPY